MQRITQEKLKEILHYDPETGLFTWRAPSANRIKVGDIAGWREPGRYTRINIGGKLYYAHRLAFLYMTGKWPLHDTDHVKGEKSDNRWEKLRDATRSKNLVNRGVRKDSISRVKGVFFDPARKKYRARVWVNGKMKYVGQFVTAAAARAAYRAFAKELHGEFYHN